jgi:predicted transcriptional regulator
MKYRNRTEIIGRILEGANENGGGATKTKIMYKAFLSYTQLQEYLVLLTESNLLQYDKVTQTFKVTDKGHRFLKIYYEVEQAMKME